jgi:hypothetical protein
MPINIYVIFYTSSFSEIGSGNEAANRIAGRVSYRNYGDIHNTATGS